MPTIKLKGDSFDISRVAAVMFYPNDGHARKIFFLRDLKSKVMKANEFHIPPSFYGQNFISAVSEHPIRVPTGPGMSLKIDQTGGSIHIPKRTFRRLLKASENESCLQNLEYQGLKAMQAGQVLLHLWRMVQANYPEPSIRKAMDLVQELCTNHRRGNGNTRVASSRASLYKCWNECKGVSHFWAGAQLCQAAFSFNPEERLYENPEDIEKLFALAEQFRKFGEEYIPPNLKVPCPVFLPHQVWRLPASYPLSPFSVQTLGKLSSWEKKVLNSYSHKR